MKSKTLQPQLAPHESATATASIAPTATGATNAPHPGDWENPHDNPTHTDRPGNPDIPENPSNLDETRAAQMAGHAATASGATNAPRAGDTLTSNAGNARNTRDARGAGAAGNNDFTPPQHWRLILALYLAGIAMGALDTAIVNPARTVIQDSLGVGDQSGVWIFTIYTLAYAAGIPVLGKVADLAGRKPVFLVAVGLFAVGSLGCGMSQVTGSFGLLLASRVLQAVGGGGIMPVATAAVTTVVPTARQGRALGLVGMVYGVTSVLGAGAGSLVLAVAGASQWQWIFFINLPVAALVIGLGAWVLPSHSGGRAGRRLDLVGIVLLVVGITALLWGFQHLDFGALDASVRTPEVWVALMVAVGVAPLFWWRETRLEARGGDPIINFRYFATPALGATLLVGAVAGFLMMTIMFVPQFAEYTLGLPRGAGGFPTVLVGLASAVGAPLSGRLTDRFGPRFVLGLGLVISGGAGVLLVLWALPFPGVVSSLVALGLLGLGMGFLMGAPLSYLVLRLVPERDANSGQATLSLVRSVATTLAPAVLVGFLASGGGVGLSAVHEGPSLGFARMFGCYTLVSLLGLALLLALPSPSQLAPHEPADI